MRETLTGLMLYKWYKQALLDEGVESEMFVNLEETDQKAWDSLAGKIESFV